MQSLKTSGLDLQLTRPHMPLGSRTDPGMRHWSRSLNRFRIERSYGAFSRSFTLPQTVEADKIKASMKDGVLEVLIPKKEDAKPKDISIEVK